MWDVNLRTGCDICLAFEQNLSVCLFRHIHWWVTEKCWSCSPALLSQTRSSRCPFWSSLVKQGTPSTHRSQGGFLKCFCPESTLKWSPGGQEPQGFSVCNVEGTGCDVAHCPSGKPASSWTPIQAHTPMVWNSIQIRCQAISYPRKFRGKIVIKKFNIWDGSASRCF